VNLITTKDTTTITTETINNTNPNPIIYTYLSGEIPKLYKKKWELQALYLKKIIDKVQTQFPAIPLTVVMDIS